MNKLKSFRIEAAGWGFWLVSTIILAVPFVYASYQVTEEHLSREIPLALGLIGASLAGAFVTFIANTIIQRSNEQRKAADRKHHKPKHKK
ncbi:MAG: hypothetical protein IT366_13730 [Candidatus Hydrogenedentes bacterium]|nr:hypothetical protein [Candidatus Hydrogenedentota bacterium]